MPKPKSATLPAATAPSTATTPSTTFHPTVSHSRRTPRASRRWRSGDGCSARNSESSSPITRAGRAARKRCGEVRRGHVTPLRPAPGGRVRGPRMVRFATSRARCRSGRGALAPRRAKTKAGTLSRASPGALSRPPRSCSWPRYGGHVPRRRQASWRGRRGRPPRRRAPAPHQGPGSTLPGASPTCCPKSR